MREFHRACLRIYDVVQGERSCRTVAAVADHPKCRVVAVFVLFRGTVEIDDVSRFPVGRNQVRLFDLFDEGINDHKCFIHRLGKVPDVLTEVVVVEVRSFRLKREWKTIGKKLNVFVSILLILQVFGECHNVEIGDSLRWFIVQLLELDVTAIEVFTRSLAEFCVRITTKWDSIEK